MRHLDRYYYRRVGASAGALGGVAAFTPASLFVGGYAGAYFDISDIASLKQNSNGTGAVTADGDPVGYVADKSGNGKNIVQPTAGKRPIYRTSGGLAWLDFDGVDDFIDYGGGNFGGVAGNDMTTGLAINYTAKNAYQNLYDHGNFSPMLWMDGSNDTEYDGQSSNKIAGLEGTNIALVAEHLNASTTVSILKNNVAQTSATRTITHTPGYVTFTMFQRAGSNAYKGKFFAGVYIYRALTSGEKSNLSLWLMGRMGI